MVDRQDPADVERLLAVPANRVEALRRLRELLLSERSVALTTHVNADGDGTGSEVAVASWLLQHGIRPVIVNPTPYPRQFRFLLDPGVPVLDWGTSDAEAALRNASVLLVLDTNEPSRIAPIASLVPRNRTRTIDHHPPGGGIVSDEGCVDPTASATGELVYDLLTLDGGSIPGPALLGIYVAIVTDTGSFRFSNTNPRTHAIASDLLGRGIDPEEVFRRLYATMPMRRIQLLREALGTLDTDAAAGLTWLVVTEEMIRRLGATAEDLDGLVDYARALEGTAVALLFRETDDGKTKVSFRSNGPADVNRIARAFGGGGHVKAAGATLEGRAADVIPRVLEVAARELSGA
jgi:bifunctional oligoribonuclease and PAP phosphatase NrnA